MDAGAIPPLLRTFLMGIPELRAHLDAIATEGETGGCGTTCITELAFGQPPKSSVHQLYPLLELTVMHCICGSLIVSYVLSTWLIDILIFRWSYHWKYHNSCNELVNV